MTNSQADSKFKGFKKFNLNFRGYWTYNYELQSK